MTRLTVSIVSEDAELLESVKNLVESVGLSAATFPTLQGLLESQERESGGCFVFCPDRNTLEDPAQQARLAAACATQPGILISEGGDVEMAVRALKAGVLDIVTTPYRDRQLLEQIRGALDASTHS